MERKTTARRPFAGSDGLQREDPTVTSHSLNLRLAQCVASGLLMITAATGAQVRPAPVEPSIARGSAPWERVVRGRYENRGIAQIEKMGNRWVLNVLCDGTHATYLDDTHVDLARYARGYVSARYHYADRTIDDPKCFRAPCPPVHERRIVLERVKTVSATPKQARALAHNCDPSTLGKRKR